MPRTLIEPVDHLPFGSLEKSRRYHRGRERGVGGRSGYGPRPAVPFLMCPHLRRGGLAWAGPHLERAGALRGGPTPERAEETARNPPRLERYDRWGHDISRVVMPPT